MNRDHAIFELQPDCLHFILVHIIWRVALQIPFFFAENEPKWVMVDLNQLGKLLSAVGCPVCECVGGIRLDDISEKRQGFLVLLKLTGTACNKGSYGILFPRVPTPGNRMKPFMINDILVEFFNQAGQGYTAMKLMGA